MINLTIQTTTNAAIFTAIGGAAAYVANSYKAILPAIPRLNPFKVAPIALTATAAIGITGAFFAGNLIVSAIYALAKEPPMPVLTKNVLVGTVVVLGAAGFGINPLTSLALIVSTIVINSILDKHVLQLSAAWGF